MNQNISGTKKVYKYLESKSTKNVSGIASNPQKNAKKIPQKNRKKSAKKFPQKNIF
jgi:hypothetical protein